MKMKHLLVLSILLISMSTVLFAQGCVTPQFTPTIQPTPIPTSVKPSSSEVGSTPMRESPPSPPIKVELSVPRPPLLNESIDLTCTVTSIYDRPNSTAQIKLPKGANLLKGNLEWQGDLKAKIPVTFSAQIVFVETGHWTIEATAKNGGGLGVVYLDIGTDHSEFGWKPVPGAVETVSPDSLGPQVGLVITHIPLLNEPAEATCTLSSSIDFPNLTVQITLPYGAVSIDGKPEWQGNLKAGLPFTFSKQIMFKQQGRNGIGWHVSQAGRTISWANPEVICLNIGESQSSLCQSPVPVPPLGVPK